MGPILWRVRRVMQDLVLFLQWRDRRQRGQGIEVIPQKSHKGERVRKTCKISR